LTIHTWNIIDGPRTVEDPVGGDWDIGWVWKIARGGEKRTIVVYVAGGRLQSAELTEDSDRAILTSGRSAVADVLGEDAPPERLVVTSTGISRQ
jgi:hypothetical protein